MDNILSALPGVISVIAKLRGFYRWLAGGCILVILVGCCYYTWVSPKPMKFQFWFVVGTVLVCGVLAAAYHMITAPKYTFSEGVSGILVLRIKGDDDGNSFRDRLIHSLDNELAKEAPEQTIEVHAYDELVTEDFGLKQAHERARKFGRKCKALLVIWGARSGENGFAPRITVVKRPQRRPVKTERTLEVVDITELKLPPELVSEPIILTHLVAGLVSYERSEYTAALAHFEAMLRRSDVPPEELSEIRFYVGNCHWHLAQGQRNMAEHLAQAIAAYEAALRVRTERESPADWATTQNNLGTAYANLPTGDRGENLRKAIACLEAALRVRTEREFPVQWATTQNNLGSAYAVLPTGDREENLRQAITYFESALTVWTETAFPYEHAMAARNLERTRELLRELSTR